VVFDPYFDRLLEEVVRVSVDNEQEVLDAILMRINTSHKTEKMSWNQFLSFFCRRGMIREGEEMVFNFDDPRGCAPTSMSTEK